MRLISSQRPRPTSPIQSSDVPGRKAILKGLRRPCAMIRRALRSGLEKSGLDGQRGPVVGVDPDDRPVEGHRVAARAQVLRAQAAALGRRRREDGADPSGRVAARVERAAVLAPVGEAEGGAVAGGRVEIAVRAELDLALRVARVLLAPVRDEHRLDAGRAQPREPSRDDAAVRVRRPAGSGTGRRSPRRCPSAGRCRRWPRRACRGRRRTGPPGTAGRAPSRAGRGPSSCAPSSAGRRRCSASCPSGCRRP